MVEPRHISEFDWRDAACAGPQLDGPDFESPLERDFFFAFVKLGRPEMFLRTQVPVATDAGRFRLDFVAQVGGRRVAIECDGKDYHHPQKDAARDAAILRERLVQRIYRVRWADLWHEQAAVFGLLSKVEPILFTERARVALDLMRSPTQWDAIDAEPRRGCCAARRFDDTPLSLEMFLRRGLAVARVEWRVAPTTAESGVGMETMQR